MNDQLKDENICRLCLKVAENGFEIIDQIITHVFEVLALKVNLDISEDPIICNDCREISTKCFNFKSTCLDTHKPIASFAVDRNEATVVPHQTHTQIVDDNFICRFCSSILLLNETHFVSSDTLMNDAMFVETLQALMPQTVLDVIENSVICTSCRQGLERYIKFVKKCWDVEDKISEYCRDKNIASATRVKLGEVLGFIYQNVGVSDDTRNNAIKQEQQELDDTGEACFAVYDDKLIKVEDTLDIKDEVNWEILSDIPGNELKIEKAQTSHDSSLTPITASYEKCTCDTIHRCGMEHETPSGISSELGTVNAYRRKSISKSKKFSEAIFKCPKCTYETRNKGNLKTHMLIHLDVTDVRIMHKCSICTFQSKRHGVLKRHTLIHKDVTEVEMYKCPTCTFQTRHKSNLKGHMVTHKNVTELRTYNCSMCSYNTKKHRNLKEHALTHKDVADIELMHKCSTCSFQTRHQRVLKRHMLIHKDVTEVEMYKCATCTFQTRHKSNLKSHMITHNDVPESGTYKCSKCAYNTKEKSSLKEHTLIHKPITEVEIMHKCSICTFQSKYQRVVNVHTLIHKNITEVETYKCSTCAFQTKYRGNLKSHTLSHEVKTEVEMYKCSMCAYSTKNKRNLKRHSLVHKDFKDVKSESNETTL